METRRRVESNLRCNLYPVFGSQPMRAITLTGVLEWLSLRLATDTPKSTLRLYFDLLDAVRNGDVHAIEIWRRSVRSLAAAMVSLINCFDPESFILGGGIAAGAGDALLGPLDGFLYEMEWRPAGHRVNIVLAELGEWAGTYGAAWQVMQQAPRSGKKTRTSAKPGRKPRL